jgi:fructan beta-fructosidase
VAAVSTSRFASISGNLRLHSKIRYRRAVLTGLGLLLTRLIFAASIRAQAPATAPVTAPATPAQLASWRPQIHFYSPSHWINDPNGPILLKGKYHTFFQWNPSGDQWGNTSWGHALSDDLIHWKQLPVAIPKDNDIFIFSGSSVEDRDNTSDLCGDPGHKTPGCVIAIYTGASKAGQTQNIAYSRDSGTTWMKYSANPVLDAHLNDFRDPKVFWHAASHSWVMVVSLPDQHKLRFYRSMNLRQWEQAGEFGPAGVVAGVWECPDLIELPVINAAGKRISSRWLLSVNLYPGGPATGSGNQYFVGQFDGFHFTEDHPGSGPHWVDWGKDWYASTTFANVPGSTEKNPEPIWLAWMTNTQYAGKLPSLPGRGEFTIPRHIYFRKSAADQALNSSQEPLVLVQEPISGIRDHAFSAALISAPRSETIGQINARLAAHAAFRNAYLLSFTLEPGDASEAGVRLSRSVLNPDDAAAEETVVGIDTANASIFVDRTRSGETDWASEFPVRVSASLKHAHSKSISIQVVVDSSSIEVFAEDGETVLTNLVYPAPDSQGLAFYAADTSQSSMPAHIRDLKLTPIGQSTAAR